jgi:ADP-ribose pyrophosphatase
VREDIAEMPNGRSTIYGVVSFDGCVGVLPFVDRAHVVMVRQYRYVYNENHRWEMPTGGIHPGESIEESAQRELVEEVGYRAGRLTKLSTYYTSKSVVHEVGHLYMGEDLVQASALPDETEFLEVGILPFRHVLDLTLASEIRDSMTVIAVLAAARLRGD